jgi:hypothetical protein
VGCEVTHLAAARVVDCRIVPVTVGAIDYLAARFDVDVVTDGPIQLGPTMDALAAKVPAEAAERVHAWPVKQVNPPCAVVGYPDEPIAFDATFQRGSDRATIPIYFLVGGVHDRTARDALSAILTGATGIKDAIDGPLESEA